MPKLIPPLSFARIKAAKPKKKLYKLSDGGGLSLWVYPSGLMKWSQSFLDQNKKQNTVYLGNYPDFSLDEARAWRSGIKKRLAQGLPAIEKKIDDERFIFENVLEDWLERWRPDVSDRYGLQVERAIKTNILPKLKGKDIREIRRMEIVDSLRTFEARGKLEYLRRTKYGLKIMFDFAMNSGYIDSNPVASITASTFKKHKTKHHDALSPKELPDLIRFLESGRLEQSTRLAIYWTLLTMTRPTETTDAVFSEIDLDKKQWIISSKRMKLKKEHKQDPNYNHIIPLSTALLSILAEIQAINVSGTYLFEGITLDKPISRETPRVALRRAGLATTYHGLRSLGRTYLAESGLFDRDVLEMLIAHTVGDKTERAYNRALRLDDRKKALEWWGNEVMKHKENITL